MEGYTAKPLSCPHVLGKGKGVVEIPTTRKKKMAGSVWIPTHDQLSTFLQLAT